MENNGTRQLAYSLAFRNCESACSNPNSIPELWVERTVTLPTRSTPSPDSPLGPVTYLRRDVVRNWEFLPQGVNISSVLYGDINNDNLNDIVLRLSNGAAYVYQSNSDAPRILSR